MEGSTHVDSDWKARRYTDACILHTITQAHQPWHSSAKTATNKVPYYQLLLLNSISDEELSQTIGVICSSMGGGGLGLLRSHECTEFITPGAQMVSGCLSQVQVHVRDMHAQKQNETTQPRQTDVDDRDTAIVLFHQNDCSCPRCMGHLITWANTRGSMQTCKQRCAFGGAHGEYCSMTNHSSLTMSLHCRSGQNGFG